MVTLKVSKVIDLELVDSTLDLSVRQYKDEDRYIYFGQFSQLIQFKEKELEQVIEFLNKAKSLITDGTAIGWLK